MIYVMNHPIQRYAITFSELKFADLKGFKAFNQQNTTQYNNQRIRIKDSQFFTEIKQQ